MDFDVKITDKNLIIYCSNNLEKFADEFKLYYYENIERIKKFFNINGNIEIIVALTDKTEETNFVYEKSSFSGFFTDTGAYAYIDLNGDKSKEYMFKGLMHEITHHLYKYYVYGKEKERIVWVDEGLAQFLSKQKDDLQDDFIFEKFLIENVKNSSDINLNELNHNDKSFGNENGYNLSYIAIRYLYEKIGNKKFIEIIKDENKLKQIGSTIIKEISNSYDVENILDRKL